VRARATPDLQRTRFTVTRDALERWAARWRRNRLCLFRLSLLDPRRCASAVLFSIFRGNVDAPAAENFWCHRDDGDGRLHPRARSARSTRPGGRSRTSRAGRSSGPAGSARSARTHRSTRPCRRARGSWPSRTVRTSRTAGSAGGGWRTRPRWTQRRTRPGRSAGPRRSGRAAGPGRSEG
jgi:hypothetical protein